MTKPTTSGYLTLKRLEMADRLLIFLSTGEKWADILALLVELGDIDPNFDKIVQNLESTAKLSEQVHGISEIDLVRDLGLLIAGVSHAGIVVEVPDAGREFLGARFVSDNRGIGWLVMGNNNAEVKIPAYVVSEKAAQHLPVLPELKTGIETKRLKHLLVIHDFRMVREIKDTLKDLYGLTGKETEVCQHILKGENATQLAVSMNVTRETVKSHLKQIFQKTNLRSQLELVRVLTQLTSVAAILNFKAKATASKNLTLKQDYIFLQSEICKTRYGTDLCYSVCGDPNGRPMILFHSPFGSRLTWEGMAMAAKRHGIKLYCFDRPGYGNSGPVPDYGAKSIAACIDDLLKANGHDRADLIGFGFGASLLLDACPYVDCSIDNVYLYFSLATFYLPGSRQEKDGRQTERKTMLKQFSSLLRTNPTAHSALWKILRRIKSKTMMARIIKQTFSNSPADIWAMEDRDFFSFLVDGFFISGLQGANSHMSEFVNINQPLVHEFSTYEDVNIIGVFGLEGKNYSERSNKKAQNFLQKFPHSRFITVPDQGDLFVLADFGDFIDAAFAWGMT